MKYYLLLFISFICLAANAQNKLSPEGRMFYREFLQVYNPESQSTPVLKPEFVEKHDISYHNGEPVIGVLALLNGTLKTEQIANYGIIVGSQMGSITSLRVPLKHFSAFLQMPELLYAECGSADAPYLERSRYSLRSDSVFHGLGDLKMPYTGKGVVIAIIDWGFDYTHPMFYDSTLENYRVVRAWDQNKQGGPAPAGFTFGTEYKTQTDLLAAKEDTLYVFGPMSHGTHVAGIAGGSGGSTKNRGIAPEADLIFISLRRDAASFMDAISYINQYAESVHKPFVVNMSFGNFSGPNDGSSLKNKIMDSLAGRGKVFVASAGNNGGQYFHLYNDFSSIDTLTTEVQIATGIADYWGELINIWGDSGKHFEIQLELADGSNNPIFVSDWFKTLDNLTLFDTIFKNAGDTLILNLISDPANFLNNKTNIYLEARKLGNKKLILRIKGTGPTHAWHVIKLRSRATNWGVSFRNQYPGAVMGDARNGIGGPPGVGREVITVASHIGEVRLPDGTEALGIISSFSSEGPLVDGRMKPDVSGPGEQVLSSVNSFDPTAIPLAETVTHDGRTYGFMRLSGTSMSSPAVAGVVALMLQVNPWLHAREIKEILWATIRLDDKTGDIDEQGHVRWGRGKVNAYAAVRMAELHVGTRQVSVVAPFQYYPNPALNKQLVVETNESVTVRMISVQGVECLGEMEIQAKGTLELHHLKPGVYFLEWKSGKQFGMEKIVIP